VDSLQTPKDVSGAFRMLEAEDRARGDGGHYDPEMLSQLKKVIVGDSPA
jgi:hypothetical protein